MKTRLKIILRDIKEDVESSKKSRPVEVLQEMIRNAPPLRSFATALRKDFGLIAEIKKKSPSAGSMRSENVKATTLCYERSPLVHAISVLTNKHFGMSIESLTQAKHDFSKPILRKDFILDEYQIYEARAYGADAVLLMGNIGVTKSKLLRLWQVAQELNLDVLFESHTKSEIEKIPDGATIYGINCRVMDSSEDEKDTSWFPSNIFKKVGTDTDFARFSMIRDLPSHAVKVAESGINPGTVKNVKDRGYDAALVGTALLTASEGLQSALGKFEKVLATAESAKVEGRWLEHATA